VTDWYEMKVLTYASTLTETVPAKIRRKAMHKKTSNLKLDKRGLRIGCFSAV